MTRTALLPALLLAFTLTACGGEDEGEPEAEPLTKSEFTTQANEICADGNTELEASAAELGEEPSQEEIEAFAADTLVPNLQDQHDELADLAAPGGDEEEVSAILDSLQEGIDAVEADPALLTSSDDPLAEASGLAAEYGLEECAA